MNYNLQINLLNKLNLSLGESFKINFFKYFGLSLAAISKLQQFQRFPS